MYMVLGFFPGSEVLEKLPPPDSFTDLCPAIGLRRVRRQRWAAQVSEVSSSLPAIDKGSR